MKLLKHTLFIACFASLLFACKSKEQQEAEKTVAEIMKETGIGNVSAEMYMTATIDGQKWAATRIVPVSSAGSNYKTVSGESNEYTITFNLYKPETGKKEQMSKDFAADLFTDNGFFSGKKGEITVTEASDKWVAGTFYFTATSSMSNKVIEVKDGTFRVERLGDPQ